MGILSIVVHTSHATNPRHERNRQLSHSLKAYNPILEASMFQAPHVTKAQANLEEEHDGFLPPTLNPTLTS